MFSDHKLVLQSSFYYVEKLLVGVPISTEMKRLNSGVLFLILIACWQHAASAAYYNRQSYPGQGAAGVIGSSTLSMSNSISTVYVGLNRGSGSFTDNLVMFIDSVPGGYTTTSGFPDRANPLETAISGYSSGRSTANFAPGFAADYAIVVGVDNGCGVYQLVTDDLGTHVVQLRTFNIAPIGEPNAPQFWWQFDWSEIGLPRANTNFFKFETSLISQYGYRYLQSFEGFTGVQGFNTVTFTNYDTYGVPPIPEATTSALAIFGVVAASASLITRFHRRRRHHPEA
jgi:hypothetical protein